MKILKPGRVEQRKFVCGKCGCIFVAHKNETEFLTVKNAPYVFCPTCNVSQDWCGGKPYEESTQDDREYLVHLMGKCPLGTEAAADYLLSYGVTFREG